MTHLNLRGRLSLFLALAVTACAPAKEPFLTARVCLPAAEDVLQFKQILQNAAIQEGLDYVGQTEFTRKELEALGNPPEAVRDDGFMLSIGVLDEDGRGLTAMELDGPGFQVGLGFSEGSDPAKARAFAKRLVGMLRNKWKVDAYDGGPALHPMANCK